MPGEFMFLAEDEMTAEDLADEILLEMGYGRCAVPIPTAGGAMPCNTALDLKSSGHCFVEQTCWSCCTDRADHDPDYEYEYEDEDDEELLDCRECGYGTYDAADFQRHEERDHAITP
jgi:hypothetical protein